MNFDDWFYEMEGFGFRAERCASDFDSQNWTAMVEWLRTAYQTGYESAKEYNQTVNTKFAGNYPGPLYAPHPDLKNEQKN